MRSYTGKGHNREPNAKPVFEQITSEEISGTLAIWDERNKETVVVSDYYIEL